MLPSCAAAFEEDDVDKQRWRPRCSRVPTMRNLTRPYRWRLAASNPAGAGYTSAQVMQQQRVGLVEDATEPVPSEDLKLMSRLVR